MAGKITRNSKRIGRKFRTEAVLWALIFAVCGFVLGYGLSSSARLFGIYALVLGAIVCAVLFVISLIIGLIIAGSRTRKVMKQAKDRELFDTDPLHEAGSSDYIFLGEHHLVWNKGRHFRIIAKEDILSAEVHPDMREGNDLGLLVIEKTDGTTEQLAYNLKDDIDLPEIINEWLVPEI